mmetsp:Transcript_5222/g.32856  ORF Transcript_5222/g.32856 Transcript_5222/m.32856 type:complete len:266 (-) Transcript_5222:165-962(-)
MGWSSKQCGDWHEISHSFIAGMIRCLLIQRECSTLQSSVPSTSSAVVLLVYQGSSTHQRCPHYLRGAWCWSRDPRRYLAKPGTIRPSSLAAFCARDRGSSRSLPRTFAWKGRTPTSTTNLLRLASSAFLAVLLLSATLSSSNRFLDDRVPLHPPLELRIARCLPRFPLVHDGCGRSVASLPPSTTTWTRARHSKLPACPRRHSFPTRSLPCAFFLAVPSAACLDPSTRPRTTSKPFLGSTDASFRCVCPSLVRLAIPVALRMQLT